MAQPSHNRPTPCPRVRARWGWLVLAALLFAGPAPLAAQDAADRTEREKQSERAESRTVHFADLGVVSEKGRLVVDYDIAAEDWKRLEDLDVWMQLRIPTDRTYPNDYHSYTMPLDARSGRQAFPRWLDTDAADAVEACLLGTGPTDNLVYGRGYTCETPVSLTVDKTRPPEAEESHTFELSYVAGPPYVPYAPWVEPRVPDFQGPFDQLPAP